MLIRIFCLYHVWCVDTWLQLRIVSSHNLGIRRSLNSHLQNSTLGVPLCHNVLEKGLPWWLSGKEFACNAGATGNVRSSLGRELNPHPWATVYRVAKGWSQLKPFSTHTSWINGSPAMKNAHLIQGNSTPCKLVQFITKHFTYLRGFHYVKQIQFPC